MVDGMSEVEDLTEAAGHADPEIGLRAALALRRLAETLERLQVRGTDRLDAESVRARIRALVDPGTPLLDRQDAEALRSIGIDLDAVLARIEATFGPDALSARPARKGWFGRRAPSGRFSVRAKKVLELSLREALRLKDNHIGSGHVLLGLLREGEGLAAQILVEAGYDLGDLRSRAERLLRSAA